MLTLLKDSNVLQREDEGSGERGSGDGKSQRPGNVLCSLQLFLFSFPVAVKDTVYLHSLSTCDNRKMKEAGEKKEPIGKPSGIFSLIV